MKKSINVSFVPFTRLMDLILQGFRRVLIALNAEYISALVNVPATQPITDNDKEFFIQ